MQTTLPPLPAGPRPAVTEAAIDVICLRQSYDALFARGVTTAFNAAATGWIISTELGWARLAPWVAVVWVLSALRMAFGRWAARARTDEEIRRALPVFVTLMVLPAMTWGALIAVAGFSHSMLVITAILLAIAGMMAAGAHTTALTPRVMVSSVVFSFTPIFGVMAFSGEPVLWAVVVTSSGYIVTVLAGMKVNNREARQSIALRFANQDLLDRLVVEKESAERANREKTRFLAAASHDVRQPLHAMGLFVDTLKEQRLDADARRLLSSIALAHGSLVSLHEGLLDVSVFDAGGVVAKPRMVDSSELLRHLENEASPKARERGLSLEVAGPDLVLQTDPDLLLRVLRNLVGNALAYTHEGRVLVSVRRRAGKALFQVWDTGIGIPKDQFELIFKELHQVGNQQRDRTKGLGLGLSIVQRLGTALGFEVKVRSVLGKGSVFSFSVPLAATGASAPPLEVEQLPPLVELQGTRVVKPGTVALLVDDDALARSALASMLGQWGYEVVAAQNAEDALQFVSDLEHLELVISDSWLPGGDGLALLTEVGKASPKLRRVLISGDTAPATEASAKAAGVTFIRKPVRSGQLKAALELPAAA